MKEPTRRQAQAIAEAVELLDPASIASALQQVLSDYTVTLASLFGPVTARLGDRDRNAIEACIPDYIEHKRTLASLASRGWQLETSDSKSKTETTSRMYVLQPIPDSEDDYKLFVVDDDSSQMTASAKTLYSQPGNGQSRVISGTITKSTTITISRHLQRIQLEVPFISNATVDAPQK